jgi:hypothetical protein
MDEDDLRAAVERVLADPTGFFLRLVESGDKQAANNLMKQFIHAVRHGDEIEPRLLAFIADKLQRIVDGEDPRKVFPKPTRTGRPAKGEEHFELAVAVAQRILGEPIDDEPLRDFDPANWTRVSSESDAIAEVARELDHKDPDLKKQATVKKAFQEWRRPAYWWAAYLKKRRRL